MWCFNTSFAFFLSSNRTFNSFSLMLSNIAFGGAKSVMDCFSSFKTSSTSVPLINLAKILYFSLLFTVSKRLIVGGTRSLSTVCSTDPHDFSSKLTNRAQFTVPRLMIFENSGSCKNVQ